MDTKYVIYGTRPRAIELISDLTKWGCEIAYICDDNIMDKQFEGINVIRLEELKKKLLENNENYQIIIAEKELDQQIQDEEILRKLGIDYTTSYRFYSEHYLDYLKNGITEDYRNKYAKEIDYMLSINDSMVLTPYEFREKYVSPNAIKAIPVAYDSNAKMYYYNMSPKKKLYLPSEWSEYKCKWYIANLRREQDIDSPHVYFFDGHDVGKDDIFVDIGSAEAYTTLDVIDRVKYAYVIECGDIWKKPLEYTFRGYENKVEIINKYAGDRESDNMSTLDSILDSVSEEEQLFLKADIEGMEEQCLAGMNSLLDRKKVKISICTYHNANHPDAMMKLLDKKGFKTSFSKGYIFWKGVFHKAMLYGLKNQ